MDVCPTIIVDARTKGEEGAPVGRPYKFNLVQQLFVFLLFMKHDNISMFEAFEWNWSKYVVNDDAYVSLFPTFIIA